MAATITEKKDIEATIKVNWNASELEPVKKQVIDRLRPKVKAAGFRPGKAPDNIVEREIGPNTLQQEVLESAVTHSYSSAVRELKLKAVASPQVTIEKFVPYTELEYTATIEVLPEIKLPDYKKIKLTRAKAEVKDDEIGQVVEDLRLRQAAKTVKKGGAETGDEVALDFKGSLDGKEVPAATAQNFSVRLGSGKLLPNFEEHILGKEADAETEFDVKFPDDYHDPEVAGKTLHFEAKVNCVWQLSLPDVDEQFISQISPFKSESELRGDIKKQLTAQKEDQIGAEFERQILDQLVEKSKFPVPGSLIHQQQHRLLDELRTQIESRGLGWEEYLKLSGKEAGSIEEELKPEAERRVKLAMLLSEIAKVENLMLTNDELDHEVVKMKEVYTDPKIRSELDSPEGKESVYNHLMSTKVINRLVEYVEGRK